MRGGKHPRARSLAKKTVMSDSRLNGEPGAEILGAELRLALDVQLHRALRPLLGGLSVLYAFLALVTPFFFSRWDLASWLLTAGQVAILIVFLGLYGLLRRGRVPLSWSHPLILLVGLLPLIDSLAHIYVRGNPLETLSYVLVSVGGALVFTSTRWYAAFLAIAVAAWAIVAPLSLPRAAIADSAFFVIQGTVIAALAFHVRLTALTRLESLRWLAEQRGHQLDVQNRQLRELDELKTQFVNAVTHDLRTPLTSIKGFGEFLEEEVGGSLSPQQKGFVRQIQQSSRRLERLVNDLLDFARIEAGTFHLRLVRADLGAQVRENVESLQPLFRDARVELQVSVPEAPLPAWVDPERIDQVLGNLLTNAVKFTPPGGRVAVRLFAEAGGLRCEVEDTGLGIAPEDFDKLFHRFSQLQAGNAKGGTGLGLSISKAIVEAHGGCIGVESELGRGSLFWFTLPDTSAGPPELPGARPAEGA
jgi:signal transduction histidine kinase